MSRAILPRVLTPRLEAEYIRNLKNQNHYLELECKFLRDEVEKAKAR